MAEGVPDRVWEQLTTRVHAVSTRSRMALIVTLLLLDRADDKGVVETSRAELAGVLWKLAGSRGYEVRRAARRRRIAPLLDERRKVEAQARDAIREAPPHSFARLLTAGFFRAMLADIDAAIGDPTGQNISHVMSELVEAGVIASRAYIDQAGGLHDKPARGRIYYLQLADWLRPAESSEHREPA